VKVRTSSAAESEITESLQFYFEESSDAASDFMAELDEASELIGQQPTLYPVYYEDVRVKQLDRFPFSIYFSIGDDDVYILSVAHNSRKPDFWKRRL
jgi:plasmid stabilization system protein ParE